jgi:diguanylate cyclase (GGDEF)-like protein
MHVDLITLYLLAIGTLLASAGMTLWECRIHPKRSKELRILAAGYGVLALGCAAATWRHALPGLTGSALSNLVIVTGYLLVLRGVAALNGRRYNKLTIGVLAVLALTWALAGVQREGVMWAYVSAIPIAVACGAAAIELLRSDGMKRLQSRHIAAAVSGVHAIFYAFRAFVLPWLVSVGGVEWLTVLGKITMYEGVLYSVVLPMTLLRLVREETHGQLLQDSQTDYLTGLGNRRWFFEEGGRIIRDHDAVQRVSLLAFDLDRFKSINDRFGHETGDAVLKSFAGVARNALGRDAVFARIGGEEFAALLPGLDTVAARAAGDAIARRFADTASHGADGTRVRATVSIGLAQLGSGASTLNDLLSAADQALYRAKSLGGNRLEVGRTAVPSAAA